MHPLLLFVLGAVWGSFLNVVIFRLPYMAVAQTGRRQSLLYLFWPMSKCPRCKTPVRPQHNIPIISYLALRGKSACCQRPISKQYPLVELFTGLLFIWCYHFFGLGVDLLLALFFFSMLLVAGIIDLRRFYLYDILTLPLLWVGLIINIDARFALLHDAVLGAAVGYLLLWGTQKIYYLATGKVGIGNGDFKLLAAIGAWLGWQMIPLALVIASIAAIGFAVYRRIGVHKKRRLIPFGPFLAIAGGILFFWGDGLLYGYQDFIYNL